MLYTQEKRENNITVLCVISTFSYPHILTHAYTAYDWNTLTLPHHQLEIVYGERLSERKRKSE